MGPLEEVMTMQRLSRAKEAAPVTGGFLAARPVGATAGAVLSLARTDPGGRSRRSGYRSNARGPR